MIIERTTSIARPITAVFDFVADARNDPLWCPKVESVDRLGDDRPGPGARYLVVHRPIPLLPSRRMAHTLMCWDPPHRLEWQEDDGHDQIAVTYRLSAAGQATTFTQRDEAQLGPPRILHPLLRIGIARDIASQLDRLRAHLETGG